MHLISRENQTDQVHDGKSQSCACVGEEIDLLSTTVGVAHGSRRKRNPQQDGCCIIL